MTASADQETLSREVTATCGCRVCGGMLYPELLLRYENMPAVAQYLPDESSLATEKGIDLKVRQCSNCGLVQLDNAPVPYYREVIRAAAYSEEMRRFRVLQFKSFMERYSLRHRKVVEIGCGRGEFVSLLEQVGMDSYGVEYGGAAVSDGVRAGLKVSRGFVADSSTTLQHAPFDAFFMLNFLEHLPDPRGTLAGIANNLAEAAVGLVEVPNFDMILRNNLFTEFTADHLLYFTAETLASTVASSGFEILECNEVWHDYIISAVVRKRKRLDLSQFRDCGELLTQEIAAFVARYGERRVAIWGAGHQALATIALTQLEGKIRYVIDSAPFKQGKFTPATHIPIVAPAMLDADPVAAVIVMAASYSDEVAALLKQRPGDSVDIAILRDYGLELVAGPGRNA